MNALNDAYGRYCAERSSEALAELYKHLLSQAGAVMWQILHESRPDLAADAASTAIVKMADFGLKSGFSTWAFTIARNYALMELRKAYRRHETGPLDDHHEEGVCDPALAKRLYGQVLERLDETEKAIFEARAAGMTFPAIARKLGLRLSATKSRYARARKRLRNTLGESAWQS